MNNISKGTVSLFLFWIWPWTFVQYLSYLYCTFSVTKCPETYLGEALRKWCVYRSWNLIYEEKHGDVIHCRSQWLYGLLVTRWGSTLFTNPAYSITGMTSSVHGQSSHSSQTLIILYFKFIFIFFFFQVHCQTKHISCSHSPLNSYILPAYVFIIVFSSRIADLL